MPILQLTIFLAGAEHSKLIAEADRKYPLETGGILMGYRTESSIVVTLIIGPGPLAVHEQARFIPDYDFHNEQVAKHYHKSKRMWGYLGDWHSHPRTIEAYLSYKDILCMKRISKSPSARNKNPIMAIVAGDPLQWAISVFQFTGLSGELTKPRITLFRNTWI